VPRAFSNVSVASGNGDYDECTLALDRHDNATLVDERAGGNGNVVVAMAPLAAGRGLSSFVISKHDLIIEDTVRPRAVKRSNRNSTRRVTARCRIGSTAVAVAVHC